MGGVANASNLDLITNCIPSSPITTITHTCSSPPSKLFRIQYTLTPEHDPSLPTLLQYQHLFSYCVLPIHSNIFYAHICLYQYKHMVKSYLVVHLLRDDSMHGRRHALPPQLVAVRAEPLVVGELCLLRLGAHGFCLRCYVCAMSVQNGFAATLRWRFAVLLSVLCLICCIWYASIVV